MSQSTAVFSDTFSDVDGTFLESHTSDSGHTWSKATGTNSSPIYMNAVRGPSSFSSNRYVPSVFPDTLTHTVDFTARANVVVSGFSSGVSVYLRYDGVNAVTVSVDWMQQRISMLVGTLSGGSLSSYSTTLSAGVDYLISVESTPTDVVVFLDGVQAISRTVTYAGTGIGILPSSLYSTNTDARLGSIVISQPNATNPGAFFHFF